MNTETAQSKPKPIVKKVVVFKEKHGDEYYDASTDELLYKTLLAVLRSRMDSGYYYYEPQAPILDHYEEYLNIPKDVAAKLPAQMQEDIKKAEKSVKQLQDDYKSKREWYDCAVHVLSLPEEEAIRYMHVEEWFSSYSNKTEQTKHHGLIWLFQEREDHQYEGWDIIMLNTL